MISIVLQDHARQFTALADAWLAAGATSLQIWEADQLLTEWPAGTSAQGASLSAPICTGEGDEIGELRLAGVTSAFHQTRLEADAQFLSALLVMNNDLDGMAGALSEIEDQLLALYALNRNSLSHLDIDQLLASLVKQVTRLVKAQGAFTLLWPSKIVQHPETIATDVALLGLLTQLRDGAREILLNGDEAPITNADSDDSLFVIRLPVYDGDELPIAALGIWLNRPPTTLSPDLKLARSIAQYAGSQIEIALQHQDLLTKGQLQAEMELARQVQLSLLPRSAPHVQRLDLFAESQPALEVGGDFYDFYAPDVGDVKPERGPATGQFAFSVGDVSGKGMPAALLMAMTRTTLRDIISVATHLPISNEATRQQLPLPQTMLDSANHNLYDDFTDVGMLATLFVGHFDPATRSLTFANAGHSPVVYCPFGEEAYLLEADGTALGVLPVSLSENQTITLQPNDLLVVGTDGFNEAHNLEGEMFGYDRLLKLTTAIAAQSAESIARTLYEAVGDFARDRPQDDDQTIVVIKGIN